MAGRVSNSDGNVAVNDVKAAIDLNGRKGGAIFYVRKYGAKAYGKTDNAQVMIINVNES